MHTAARSSRRKLNCVQIVAKIRSPWFQPKPQTPLSQYHRGCFAQRAARPFDACCCIVLARAASGSMARSGGKQTFAAGAKASYHNGKSGLLRRQISTFAGLPPLDATKRHSILYPHHTPRLQNFLSYGIIFLYCSIGKWRER